MKYIAMFWELPFSPLILIVAILTVVRFVMITREEQLEYALENRCDQATALGAALGETFILALLLAVCSAICGSVMWMFAEWALAEIVGAMIFGLCGGALTVIVLLAFYEMAMILHVLIEPKRGRDDRS